jgi:AraC-like DNA-binding protein
MEPSGNSVKFWRVHGLRNLELLHAAHTNRALTRRINEGFEICVIEHGTQKLYYRGGSHLAPAGSVVIINPGEAYSAQGEDKTGWTYRAFYPTSADVRDAASEAAGKRLPVPSFPKAVIHDQHVTRILRELHLLLLEPNAAMAQESYSIWVASELVTRHAATGTIPRGIGSERKAVRLAREFIEANHSDNIALSQISTLTGLSSFHLLRVFTREVGMPPHAYLNQVRINRARRLLSLGWAIARVANEIGFVDQSHFSKHFKRMMGVTPGQYASSVRPARRAS